MIIIPILRSIFRLASIASNFVEEVIKNNAIESELKALHEQAKKVVSYLGNFSKEVKVEFSRSESADSEEIERYVSILWKVRPSNRENYIEQHKTFCLNFGSPEMLCSDIHTLASMYHDVYGQVCGFAEDDSEVFWQKINELQQAALKSIAKTRNNSADPHP